MMHNLFHPCWKIKHILFPNLLNLSVWREYLPVLDNLTRFPSKSIKFLRFWQIRKVNVSRINLCLNHKSSIKNTKSAIHLQLGGTILLILIFILNSYRFIWKTLAFLKYQLKWVWYYYMKIYGNHAGGREVFFLA